MAWIVGLCSVLFDIDVGPKVQDLVDDPVSTLTPEERQDVAFHAFPVSTPALPFGVVSAIRIDDMSSSWM